MSAVRAGGSATRILTRRGIVKAVPAAVVASTVSIAFAEGTSSDAELLALRPVWITTRAEFEDALKALNGAYERFSALAPEPLDFHSLKGSMNEFCAEQRRLHDIRDALEIETGFKAAQEAEDRTSMADSAVVERISSIPARTAAGIRFKKEVLDDWKGCRRDDIEESLLADLLAMGGFDA